jgi:PAS domain S-box-containing protein
MHQKIQKKTKYVVIYICLISMAIGFVTIYILVSMEYDRIHEKLINFAMIRDSFFRIQLEMNINELEGLQHFCEISNAVDCDRFDKFTEIVLSGHKDIRSLEWIPCVKNEDRDRFVSHAQKKGLKDFEILEYADDHSLVRAKDRNVYYPVYYIKNKEETEHVPGYDLGASPEFREIIKKARDTGNKIATKETRVLHDEHIHNLFIMMIPIYKNAYTPDTIQERRKNLRGLVLGSFCIRAMSESVIKKTKPAGINIFVFDQTSSDSVLLFTHISRLEKDRTRPKNLSPEDIYDPLQYVSTIEVGGRQWCFIYTPCSHYIYDHISWWPFSIILIEFIIAAWIIVYVINNRNRATFIHRKINEAEGSLKKFKKAVEVAGHAIYITDSNGNIEYINPAFIKLTGYEYPSVIGKPTRILKSNKMGNTYYKNLWGTLLKGEIWCEEVINKRKDGQLYTAMQTISPIINKKGAIENFVGIQMDITRQKEVENLLTRRTNTLKEAQLKAEDANRAKSIFLANMSHEIRTPMNAVIGFSDLLYSVVTDKTQKSYIESIRSAGKNLLQIINDILDLSKIEAGKLQIQQAPVNPHVIFDEIKKMFMFKKKEQQIDFILEIDPGIPRSLLLDEVRLSQVLINVVGNALKFTEKGYIKIKAENLNPNNTDRIDLLISIEDTGIGIEKDQLEAIFEAFKQQDSQSTKKYGGTGLGLSITRHLLHMMNGEIRVKSETGKGSIFEITLRNIEVLPVHPESLVLENTLDFKHYSFEKATVLIVDDVESNRLLLKSFFLKTKAGILEATNGQEGVELAKQHIPDVILMDIKMPVMDGYEALAHIRNDPVIKNIPVIALTAGSSDDQKKEKKRFNAYLMKPVNIRNLFERLSCYLKTDPTISEQTQISLNTRYKEASNAQNVLSEVIEPEALIQELETKMMPQWESLTGAIDIDEINSFAQQLIDLAQKHHATQLVHYAKILLEYAESFEIEKIEETLASFSNCIQGIGE